ncbi:hypothetical protein J5I95_17330 [Candidatus Poribacteria bacterium]|nr:hypothetical protein [Candidatus Poribacteria bacterium]
MAFQLCALMLALLMLVVPVFAQVAEKQKGRADVERDAKEYGSLPASGAMGFACGCLGIAYIYFATPDIPVGVLLGKSPTYVETYTRIYRYHVNRRRLQVAAVGCGIAGAMISAYWLFVAPNFTDTY